MWEKAVLKAPFCFVRPETERAVNPATQLAKGLHYHKGVEEVFFFLDGSVCWKPLALVPKLLKESPGEKLWESGEWQVKWWGGKKKRNWKAESLAHLHSAMLWIVNWVLPLHRCIHTMTFPHARSLLFHPLVPPRMALCTRVKRRKGIWVRRRFPDFTPSICFLVHPSSLTQHIHGLYRKHPLCHSRSRVMAIRAISLSSIPVCVNMTKACCKHTIQLQNNVISKAHAGLG